MAIGWRQSRLTRPGPMDVEVAEVSAGDHRTAGTGHDGGRVRKTRRFAELDPK